MAQAAAPNTDARPIALTMGEPSGIGGEIAVGAWRALRKSEHVFFLIDDPARIRRLGAPVEIIDDPANAAEAFADTLPVLDIGVTIDATPGAPSADHASAVIASIERAAALALDGCAAAVVTNPLQKSVLMEGGFGFPGHTEFLGELCRSARMPGARRRGPVMMLAAAGFRTVPATVHIPLAEVASHLNADSLIETAIVTLEALRDDFGVASPRLAVCGLNPHAGEAGNLGDEELKIIGPAIDWLRHEYGADVAGPFAADSLFHEEARRNYDAALCMYHDQALIPIKTIAFHEAVNVTLGLPIIRTSPDHGTALDLAGAGKARPDSLIAAIRLAGTLAENRRNRQ